MREKRRHGWRLVQQGGFVLAPTQRAPPKSPVASVQIFLSVAVPLSCLWCGGMGATCSRVSAGAAAGRKFGLPHSRPRRSRGAPGVPKRVRRGRQCRVSASEPRLESTKRSLLGPQLAWARFRWSHDSSCADGHRREKSRRTLAQFTVSHRKGANKRRRPYAGCRLPVASRECDLALRLGRIGKKVLIPRHLP